MTMYITTADLDQLDACSLAYRIHAALADEDGNLHMTRINYEVIREGFEPADVFGLVIVVARDFLETNPEEDAEYRAAIDGYKTRFQTVSWAELNELILVAADRLAELILIEVNS